MFRLREELLERLKQLAAIRSCSAKTPFPIRPSHNKYWGTESY